EARLPADPTAVGGQLRPPATDPAPVGGELRTATDPRAIGGKLGLPTDPRAIGRELRGAATDPRAVGGDARLRADRGYKPADEECNERTSHGVRDDTCQRGWFVSLEDARRKIEAWRVDYNQQRPNSALGHLTRSEFATHRQDTRPAANGASL